MDKNETSSKKMIPVSQSQRNSSVELLRLIAMLFILQHHFIVHNINNAAELPLDYDRIIFEVFMAGTGKIGVVIFFSISVWYLLDKEQTSYMCLRRVWLMEKELIFWNVLLLIFYSFQNKTSPSFTQCLWSFFPLSTGVWWYATSYAIFLAILPFLSKGLRLLGRTMHLALLITVLCIWGALGFFPTSLTPQLYGVFGFFYLFVIISAVKWYFKPFSTEFICLLVTISIAIIGIYSAVYFKFAQYGYAAGVFITADWKIPVIIIGFGLFLIADRIIFYNRVINFIAKSAFSVYLLTDSFSSEQFLWGNLFTLFDLVQESHTIIRVYAILLCIFVVCILLDVCRRGLFALTVDRRPGKVFDLIWTYIAAHKAYLSKLSKLLQQ